MKDRINYWRRIFKVYFSKTPSYSIFWHEKSAVSEGIIPDKLGVYYMTFSDKADYAGPKDENGVILFDYFFDIGRQYNPLAVAQYGLGHYNKYLEFRIKNLETEALRHLGIAKIQADWLVKNLENNDFGIPVWKHKFRWHYKKYLEAAQKAFLSLNLNIKKGGVEFIDENGNVWLEEYLVEPATHILNGFLWALWGVWDYYLLSGDEKAKNLFNACVKTLKENLSKYDAGFWSLYDLSQQAMKMIASHFYQIGRAS